jgi:Holliday junction resolvase RusA-like endonuclease
MSESITFTVYGHPEPQGSFRAMNSKYSGKAILTQSNKKMLPYRQMVSQTAMVECRGRMIAKHEPVMLGLSFYFAKPKSAPKSRAWPTVKPDLDKLVRCIKDALTGFAYVDDSQVVKFSKLEKLYGSPERTVITVEAMENK